MPSFLAMRLDEDGNVLLRPGDTFANIALKTHLSFQAIFHKIVFYYEIVGVLICDVGP
jgi:hypothetical protein